MTELSNKQYVDNNIQIVNNSILVTNNTATALTTRVGTLETRATTIEGVNTSQATSITAIQNVNIAQGTSITNIDALNVVQNTRLTTVEGVNTTQGTQITALQQKSNHIVYTTPVAGPLTEMTSSLSLLPFTSATIMRAYTVSCQAINSLGQSTFGGVGFTTARAQFGGFGIPIQTIYFGSVTSVVGTSNLVTFTTALTGPTFPKIFLQATNGNVVLVTKSLAGFVYSATVAGLNIDYWVVQGV